MKATGAAARIFQQVHALQMAVSKRQVKTVPVVAPAAKPPKVTREFAMEFERGAWTGQVPPVLARTFGSSHARRAAHWLHTRLVPADRGSIVWVSFVQLYIDYQLSWGNPGPLLVQKQWVDLDQRPYLTAEAFPFRTRVRWFRRFLKTFLWLWSRRSLAQRWSKPFYQLFLFRGIRWHCGQWICG